MIKASAGVDQKPGDHLMEAITTTIRGRGLSPGRLVAIADRLEKAVAAPAIPGAMIVIGSHNRVIFERTVGVRDVAEDDPLRPDAIWRIYSMTNPIVTAAAMVLVEAGLVCCDQPVAEFIPRFAQLRVADGAGRNVPAQPPPTIQDLMRHTAGLSYGYRGDGPAHQAYVADGFLYEDLSNASFVDRLAALPLEHQPGDGARVDRIIHINVHRSCISSAIG